LNQKKGCIAVTCILCGASIAEDQCYPSGSMMQLCSNCGHRSDGLPDIFAISIERFLIGNVL
jgi:hypothetical protein